MGGLGRFAVEELCQRDRDEFEFVVEAGEADCIAVVLRLVAEELEFLLDVCDPGERGGDSVSRRLECCCDRWDEEDDRCHG